MSWSQIVTFSNGYVLSGNEFGDGLSHALVSAFTYDQVPIWQYSGSEQDLAAQIAINDVGGRLFVNEARGLTALDLTTGALLWHIDETLNSMAVNDSDGIFEAAVDNGIVENQGQVTPTYTMVRKYSQLDGHPVWARAGEKYNCSTCRVTAGVSALAVSGNLVVEGYRLWYDGAGMENQSVGLVQAFTDDGASGTPLWLTGYDADPYDDAGLWCLVGSSSGQTLMLVGHSLYDPYVTANWVDRTGQWLDEMGPVPDQFVSACVLAPDGAPVLMGLFGDVDPQSAPSMDDDVVDLVMLDPITLQAKWWRPRVETAPAVQTGAVDSLGRLWIIVDNEVQMVDPR
ncbi:MAG: hypothetical protein U0271_01590 [Polyangiaceae bacterium]